MINKIFTLCCFTLLAFAFSNSADAQDIAGWNSHFRGYGEWTESTNWSCNSQPLPAPGYPGTNYDVGVFAETVFVASQNVSTLSIQLDGGAVLLITNDCSFTVLRSFFTSRNRANVFVQKGVCNILDGLTNRFESFNFYIGSKDTLGYFDFGSVWGATSGWSKICGDWHGVRLNLINGGARIDGENVSFFENCILTLAGQELSFRGNWYNPDGTTRLILTNSFTNTITIGSNLTFNGCFAAFPLNSCTNPYICAGGNVSLSNTTFSIGRDASYTNVGIGRDLIRMPAWASLETNGLSLIPDPKHGFAATLSIDANRDGFKYLVMTPSNFWPEVAITNIPAGRMFRSGTNILISADAKGASGNIINVEFYNGASLIGICTNAPYSVEWSNVLGGAYEVKAVVHDDKGNTGESDPVDILVNGRAADGRNVFITRGMILKHDEGRVR